MQILLVGNDQSITVTGVTDSDSGEYIDDAVIQARLYNLDGTEVSGVSWPVTLSYTGSLGVYRGVLEDAIALQPDTQYELEVSVAAPGDLVAHYRETVYAQYRSLSA